MEQFVSLHIMSHVAVYRDAHDNSFEYHHGTDLGVYGNTSVVGIPDDTDYENRSRSYKAGNVLTDSHVALKERLVIPDTQYNGISKPTAALVLSVIIAYCMLED